MCVSERTFDTCMCEHAHTSLRLPTSRLLQLQGGWGRVGESREWWRGRKICRNEQTIPLSLPSSSLLSCVECLSLSLLVLPDHVNPAANGNGDCRPEKFRPTLSLLFVHRERDGKWDQCACLPWHLPSRGQRVRRGVIAFPKLMPSVPPPPLPAPSPYRRQAERRLWGKRGWILTKPYRQQLRESDLPGDTHTHSTHPVSHSPV